MGRSTCCFKSTAGQFTPTLGGDEDEDKDIELAEDDILILMYSGSRWFGMWFSSTEWGALMEDFKTFIAEFHGEFYR